MPEQTPYEHAFVWSLLVIFCIDWERGFKVAFLSHGFQLIFIFLHSFIDIDECAQNLDNCDVDTRATCSNTPGSFTCACRAGYSGNGIACVGSYF